MPIYDVYGVISGSQYLGQFEAANAEEAEEKAAAKGHVSLCHHCSRQCEDAEIIEFRVHEVKGTK